MWIWLLLAWSTVSLMGISASAQTGRYGGVGITVYSNSNFSGKSATFRIDTPDLRPYGLNDKISSFEIPNGETWEVCRDINYGNRCQVFSSSVSDLRRFGWNDTISSLRRVGRFQGQRSDGVLSSNVSPRLVIYDRPGFRGSSRPVTGQTSNVGSLGSRGGSVEVLSGNWELCDRYGRCARVSQSVPDLSQLGLSGPIASIRPMNNQRNSRGYGESRGNRKSRRDRNWGR
jgi:hypothetical protein